jgi:sugar/nucleoside kinase (ribokinase family)
MSVNDPSGTPEVISVGLATIDYLAVVRQGAPLGLLDRDLVERYSVEGGGLAATAGVACSRLGLRTAHWGCVGSDEAGEAAIASLEKEGVSTEQVVRVRDGRTPVAFGLVDGITGERRLLFYPGTGAPVDLPRFPWAQVKRAKAIVLDQWWLALSIEVAKRAKAAGVPVVADLIPGDYLSGLLAHVDALFAPRPLELERSSAEAVAPILERMHKYGPSVVGVTLGVEGSWYSVGKGPVHQPAFSVEAVDTTGAGDTFHGAIAYGLARGWEVPRTVEFASAVAALKCRALGGRPGIPRLEEALAFLRSQGSSLWRSSPAPR